MGLERIDKGNSGNYIMEENKEVAYGGLFSQYNPNDKKKDKVNPMLNILSDINEFKRQRDEDTEDLRKKQRDKMFKLRRRFEDELPEFNIPEATIESPLVPKEVMEDPTSPLKEVPLVDLPLILQEFNSDNVDTCLSGITRMRLLLTKAASDPVQELLDAGVLPRLIELLNCKESSSIQLEAAWCISNIAAGNETQVNAIIEKGGVQALIGVLESPHRKNQEQVK